MIKSFAALSITTGVRLLTSLVLFVLMAREWAAADFGQFMYLFSVAALLVLACEFGFSQQILREVGQAPEQAAPLMGRYLGAKLWLSLLTALLGTAYALLTGLSATGCLLLALLLAGAMAMSYADFYMACFRALGDFSPEARLTLKGNLIYFALATAALYGLGSPTMVAAALLLARAVHLVMAYALLRQRLQTPLPLALHIGPTLRTIRSSSAYGADVAVGAAFVNIDTVLIAHTLGNESVAIYQAVARFYQGACLLPPIFGSIFLPRLAQHQGDAPRFARDYRHLSLGLIGSGLLLALVFVFGQPLLATIYKQAHLQQSMALLPWFAMLLFVRYVASVYGVVLTALGGQTSRALIYVLALAMMVGLAPLWMRHLGVAGMVAACTAAYTLLAVLFGWQAHQRGAKARGWALSVALMLLLSALCIWKLYPHAVPLA